MTGSYSDEDFIDRVHARGGIESALERLTADMLADQSTELCRRWRELEAAWRVFEELADAVYEIIGEEE